MNLENTENKRLEELLKRAHLFEPSPDVRKQITTKAKSIWNRGPLDLPWLVPIRRLVVSAAAAMLVIALANVMSDLALSRWSVVAYASDTQPGGVELLPEIPYSPFVMRLASLNNRSSVIDASALNSHVEALRHVLDESQQSEFASPPAPRRGGSGLIPNPSKVSSYS